MKKVLNLSIILVLIFAFVSCSKEKDNQEVNKEVSNKEEISANYKTEKIISALPSATDILVGLGLGENLIAVDTFSTLDGVNENAKVIDFNTFNVESILEMEPDLIFMYDYNLHSSKSEFEFLKENGINVISLSTPNSLEGIMESITYIGDITNKTNEATKLNSYMENEIETVKQLASTIKNKKAVYFEIGNFNGTLYSVGKNTFLQNILSLVGATNIFENEDAWISVSAEEVVLNSPDIIITNNMNNGTKEEVIKEIKERPSFKTVTAIKNDDVYVINTNNSSRPSQHVIKAIKEIANVIYPEVYNFEY